MNESFPGGKKPQDLTPEEIEALDRTDKFIVPPGEPEMPEESVSAIVGRTRAREAELKKSVEDSLQGTLGEPGEPVHVISFRYIGDGKFEFLVAYGKGQRKTVVVKEPGGKTE